MVAGSLGKVKSKVEGKKKEKDKPFWQRRIERNIGEWQKDLGKVEEIRKGTKLKAEVMSRLVEKYDLLEKGCLVVATHLKNKIQSSSVKIKHFTEKKLQHRQNTLFKSNQSQVYKELSGRTKTVNPCPDAADAKAYWGGIWSEGKGYNRKADWLSEVAEELDGKVRAMENIEVRMEDLLK